MKESFLSDFEQMTEMPQQKKQQKLAKDDNSVRKCKLTKIIFKNVDRYALMQVQVTALGGRARDLLPAI